MSRLPRDLSQTAKQRSQSILYRHNIITDRLPTYIYNVSQSSFAR